MPELKWKIVSDKVLICFANGPGVVDGNPRLNVTIPGYDDILSLQKILKA